MSFISLGRLKNSSQYLQNFLQYRYGNSLQSPSISLVVGLRMKIEQHDRGRCQRQFYRQPSIRAGGANDVQWILHINAA